MSIIGHGIDLVDVERIEDMLDRHGARFLDRCFTVREQAYCESGGVQRAQRYAARFAAKEAVFKAIGTGLGEGMTWTQIEVVRSDSGQPMIELRDEVAREASQLGIGSWLVSLTHLSTHASASVIGIA